MEEKVLREFYDLLKEIESTAAVTLLKCELNFSPSKLQVRIGVNEHAIKCLSELTDTPKEEIKLLFNPVEKALNDVGSSISKLIVNEFEKIFFKRN